MAQRSRHPGRHRLKSPSTTSRAFSRVRAAGAAAAAAATTATEDPASGDRKDEAAARRRPPPLEIQGSHNDDADYEVREGLEIEQFHRLSLYAASTISHDTQKMVSKISQLELESRKLDFFVALLTVDAPAAS